MLPERPRQFTRVAWVGLAISLGAVLLGISVYADPALARAPAAAGWDVPWWACVSLLFLGTFLLGILGILGGIGGGVLFVPLVYALFPFHLDFVRGSGLLVALAGALAAGPSLLRSGMAHLRLAMPAALIASVGAIVGANVGLALPEHILQLTLGAIILGVTALVACGCKSEYPELCQPDAFSEAFGMHGVYYDPSSGRDIKWQARRTPQGLALFVVIGTLAGMFGIGAGWANVPVLNVLMGVPLKVAVGTSSLILSIDDTAAAWIYINDGAILPLIAVPSMLGMTLGAKIGATLLTRIKKTAVRKVLIGVLLLAGVRALLKGLGI